MDLDLRLSTSACECIGNALACDDCNSVVRSHEKSPESDLVHLFDVYCHC